MTSEHAGPGGCARLCYFAFECSRFAFDSDGQVWFHNDGLWSQWCTVVVHKVKNISFAGTGVTRSYHDHSSTYHSVNSGANHQREASWGS